MTFNLINKETGFYFGKNKNLEWYEFDYMDRNFRFVLGEKSNLNPRELEHSFISSVVFILKNKDKKVGMEYCGPDITIQYFSKLFFRKSYLLFLRMLKNPEKYFEWHEKFPYKNFGQDKFVMDYQIFTAYNLGVLPEIRMSKISFEKMLGEKVDKNRYLHEFKDGLLYLDFCGAKIIVEENAKYDGYYIRKIIKGE